MAEIQYLGAYRCGVCAAGLGQCCWETESKGEEPQDAVIMPRALAYLENSSLGPVASQSRRCPLCVGRTRHSIGGLRVWRLC